MITSQISFSRKFPPGSKMWLRTRHGKLRINSFVLRFTYRYINYKKKKLKGIDLSNTEANESSTSSSLKRYFSEQV